MKAIPSTPVMAAAHCPGCVHPTIPEGSVHVRGRPSLRVSNTRVASHLLIA